MSTNEVHPLTQMDPFVVFSMRGLIEVLLAKVAFVGPSVFVRVDMNDQVAFLYKLFVAVFASEWTLTCGADG